MFDLDVDGMLEHLLSIPDAILMVSNPCIELWYLLHFEKCHAELTQNVCIKKLKRHLEHYTKGTLALNEKQQLSEKHQKQRQEPRCWIHIIIHQLPSIK